MADALEQTNRFFATKEEYLDWEAKADYKSEYLAGEIVAMSGGAFTTIRLVVIYSRLCTPCSVKVNAGYSTAIPNWKLPPLALTCMQMPWSFVEK